jgi:hypothetical protein
MGLPRKDGIIQVRKTKFNRTLGSFSKGWLQSCRKQQRAKRVPLLDALA